MIHPKRGDLVAVKRGRKYYYAIVLSDQIMAGGQLVFALYHTTTKLASPESGTNQLEDGFHCITDFIFAKRASNLHRIARKLPVAHLDTFQFYRQGGPTYGLEKTWAIWDRKFNVVSTPTKLKKHEWSYPIFRRSDHGLMCERIDKTWKPEHDKAAANKRLQPIARKTRSG